ncbi:CD63 antigen, putative [Pediculus humanus corporis]|uniref:Tetraspanin n=1 Tax=Pediculus humanus subsp. corporis TaxID=121224 RepID=E0VTU4_PEDHC|nr:CD63 antigen, putative [Pediculus humanus corporis]EEB16800.1 CD63 antigen, putative [Pediculus humanus corporis]
MSLPFGAKCIKCLLFTFNLLFVVTGIILIIIGSVIKTPYSAYHYILDHGFFAIPVLLIFIGIIIFFVSFFGCCGAVKENYCMTITFGVLLLLILILEISGGIAGYVLRDKVSTELKTDLLNSMQSYNSSKDVKNMWDIAQSTFYCCGALEANDWNSFIPTSCCPNVTNVCTLNDTYKEPCYNYLENLFTYNAGALGGAGIGIAVIQILGILFSYSLAMSIKEQYESLEKD